jgi:hypothetical protein
MTIEQAKQKILDAYEHADKDSYKILAEAYSTLTNAQSTKIHQIDGFKPNENERPLDR